MSNFCVLQGCITSFPSLGILLNLRPSNCQTNSPWQEQAAKLAAVPACQRVAQENTMNNSVTWDVNSFFYIKIYLKHNGGPAHFTWCVLDAYTCS